MSPLPSSHYEVGVPIKPKVDVKSRVCVRQCKYSVPVKLIGRRVEVTLRADEVIISHSGRVVAHHERLVHRLDESLHLDHYLEILLRKPGALAASSPLAQARAAGVFTPAHDAYWEEARRRLSTPPLFPSRTFTEFPARLVSASKSPKSMAIARTATRMTLTPPTSSARRLAGTELTAAPRQVVERDRGSECR